jgi:ATP-dependent 26S proteasome regulatory subunit
MNFVNNVLRPGRFDRILEVQVPDKEARKEILNIYTKRKSLVSTVDISKLVELTGG